LVAGKRDFQPVAVCYFIWFGYKTHEGIRAGRKGEAKKPPGIFNSGRIDNSTKSIK
jgi:hypothetical protein